MTLLLGLVGAGLVALVLLDMFHTLFAPGGGGRLTAGTARNVWRFVRLIGRGNPERLVAAGPVAMVLVILLWTAILVLGWACILWPHLPEGFLLSTGMSPDQNDGFLDAVYLSVVTLGTLGYGEITPTSTWLRLLVPLEALIGFTLITAAISWVMATSPALARRRQLAREATLLYRIDRAMPAAGAAAYPDQLRALTGQAISVRNDLAQMPITHYFRTSDRDSSLELALPQLVAIARTAGEHDDPSVRFAALQLLSALGDLAGYIGRTWLGFSEDARIDEVMRAYAADSFQEIHIDPAP